MNNYYSIKPIKAYVKSNQIFNQGEYENEFTECELIALCLYCNEAITFMIKLNDGEIFRYIPCNVLYWTDIETTEYEFDTLNFHGCYNDDVKINVIDALKGDSSTYLNTINEWVISEYVLSVDFYKNDRMINLMKVESGQFAWIPFHKIKFKKISEIELGFKKFKKQTIKYYME